MAMSDKNVKLLGKLENLESGGLELCKVQVGIIQLTLIKLES